MGATVHAVSPSLLGLLPNPLPHISLPPFSHMPFTFSLFSTTYSSVRLPVATCTSDIPLFTVARCSGEKEQRFGLGYWGEGTHGKILVARQGCHSIKLIYDGNGHGQLGMASRGIGPSRWGTGEMSVALGNGDQEDGEMANGGSSLQGGQWGLVMLS